MFVQMCGPGYTNGLGRGCAVLVNSCSTRTLVVLHSPSPPPDFPHLLEHGTCGSTIPGKSFPLSSPPSFFSVARSLVYRTRK